MCDDKSCPVHSLRQHCRLCRARRSPRNQPGLCRRLDGTILLLHVDKHSLDFAACQNFNQLDYRQVRAAAVQQKLWRHKAAWMTTVASAGSNGRHLSNANRHLILPNACAEQTRN
jgi:hypothetical protein